MCFYTVFIWAVSEQNIYQNITIIYSYFSHLSNWLLWKLEMGLSLFMGTNITSVSSVFKTLWENQQLDCHV